MREQGIVLKDHSNPASFRRNPTTITGDLPLLQVDRTLFWPFKSSDQSQQRCLTATRWTEQSEELSMSDVEINSFERPRTIRPTVTMPDRSE